MRRWAITLLAAGVCAAASGGDFASAADLSLAPIYKAPAAPAPYDWTGFYAGGHIGGAWDRRDGSVFDAATGAFLTSGSAQSSNLTGGGQVGFNYALSRNWIAGLEADISAADLQSSAIGATAFGERDNKIDAFGTVRGRFGYAWNNVWLYGTAALPGHMNSSRAPSNRRGQSRDPRHAGIGIGYRHGMGRGRRYRVGDYAQLGRPARISAPGLGLAVRHVPARRTAGRCNVNHRYRAAGSEL